MVYDFSQNFSMVPDSYEVKGDADKRWHTGSTTPSKRVSDDIGERFNFNTAISTIMELVNEMYRYKEGAINPGLYGLASSRI